MLKPLSQFAEAWRTLPGISEWVLNTIINCYMLKFARRPPPVQRRGYIRSSSHKHSSSKSRNTQSPRQRSRGGCGSRGTRDRFLQPLFFSSKKGRRSPPYPRSASFVSCSSKTLIQNDYTETNPIARSAPGLVYFSGSKGCLFPYPDSPFSQAFSEICFRRGGLLIFFRYSPLASPWLHTLLPSAWMQSSPLFDWWEYM